MKIHIVQIAMCLGSGVTIEEWLLRLICINQTQVGCIIIIMPI